MSSLLAVLLLISSTLALPTRSRFSNARQLGISRRQGTVKGTVGLGDNSDLLYTVPIEIGGTTTAVNIDTGSSDLWIVSDACTKDACASLRSVPIPSANLKRTGANVTMRYGDSVTGTFAFGDIVSETVSVAGVAIENQMFAAVSDTTNTVVQFGAAGIFGLGFPTESLVQSSMVQKQFGTSTATDNFFSSSHAYGPLIFREAATNQLTMPMFSISLQRSTIDISGTGALTLGDLPPGVDNSTITWVPVRRYTVAEGGVSPPSFALDEVYPLRWEIDLDAVFIDGQKLAPSTVPATGGVDATRMSALIDTGNSILRGPSDTVSKILSTVSPNYDPTVANSATLACAKAHNLAFQIGGKLFPIDPRDLISQAAVGDASNCAVENLVATDAPGIGALFRWSLGDPFFKSNLVVFHYGNLTHPSQDPPRIGFLSQVPTNAADLLAQDVQKAQLNGGNFQSSIEIAPTAAAAAQPDVTVSDVPTTAAATQATAATGGAPGSAVTVTHEVDATSPADPPTQSDKPSSAHKLGSSSLVALGLAALGAVMFT